MRPPRWRGYALDVYLPGGGRARFHRKGSIGLWRRDKPVRWIRKPRFMRRGQGTPTHAQGRR